MSLRTSLERGEQLAARLVPWLVAGLVLAGFLLRVRAAAGTYYNGDEAHIVLPTLQGNPLEVYRFGLRFPYGPFGNFLLYVMGWFGSSEMLYRMPSIVAGALLPAAAYRWLAFRFHAAAGLIVAAVLALSPNLVLLSAEVRHYTIHALFLVLAVDALERALAGNSRTEFRRSGLFLVLALLTMYMTIWFLAAFAAYTALRMWQRRPPAWMMREFAVLLALCAAILTVAYFTHLVDLRGSQGEIQARDGWLRNSYFQPTDESMWQFLGHASLSLSQYAVPVRFGGAVLLLFLAGVAVAAAGRIGTERWSAASLVLPVAATAGAALLRLYPFGGSRHDLFLVPFVLGGVALALTALAARRTLAVLALGLLAGGFALAAHPARVILGWYVQQPVHRRADLDALLAHLRRDTAHRVIVMDQETRSLMNVYLCEGRIPGFRYITPDLITHECGRWRILERNAYLDTLENLAAAYGPGRSLEPETLKGPAWILSHTAEAAGRVETPGALAFGRFRLLSAD